MFGINVLNIIHLCFTERILGADKEAHYPILCCPVEATTDEWQKRTTGQTKTFSQQFLGAMYQIHVVTGR